MKNKIYLSIIITFLIFCFIIFYNGLNNSNIYTPKINKKKLYLFLKQKSLVLVQTLDQRKFLKKIISML